MSSERNRPIVGVDPAYPGTDSSVAITRDANGNIVSSESIKSYPLPTDYAELKKHAAELKERLGEAGMRIFMGLLKDDHK